MTCVTRAPGARSPQPPPPRHTDADAWPADTDAKCLPVTPSPIHTEPGPPKAKVVALGGRCGPHKAKVVAFAPPEERNAPPDAAAAPAPIHSRRRLAAPAAGRAKTVVSQFQETGRNTAKWCGYEFWYLKKEIWTWLYDAWWMLEGPMPKHDAWDSNKHRWVKHARSVALLSSSSHYEVVQASSPPASFAAEGASAPPESPPGLAPPPPPLSAEDCAGGLERGTAMV